MDPMGYEILPSYKGIGHGYEILPSYMGVRYKAMEPLMNQPGLNAVGSQGFSFGFL